MARLGTDKAPVRFRAQTEGRLRELADICDRNGWKFIGGLEPDEPEDTREVEYLLDPKAFFSQPRMRGSTRTTVVREKPKIGRNEPCPCGSGLKYKKCCMKSH
jgi:preprotein translocase subunit SecA